MFNVLTESIELGSVSSHYSSFCGVDQNTHSYLLWSDIIKSVKSHCHYNNCRHDDTNKDWNINSKTLIRTRKAIKT